MIDTDIKALVERLRKGAIMLEEYDGDIGTPFMFRRAADALEALQHAQDMFTADFNDCNSERARWKARAEKAEAALAERNAAS